MSEGCDRACVVVHSVVQQPGTQAEFEFRVGAIDWEFWGHVVPEHQSVCVLHFGALWSPKSLNPKP